MNREVEFGDGQDLMFIGIAHPGTTVGDSNEEILELDPNDYTAADLAKAEVEWLPITVGHNEDQAVGVVAKKNMGDTGAKYVTAVVARDSDLGKKMADDLLSGKPLKLSLSHEYQEMWDHDTGTITQRRMPHRVGLVENPNRPGCDILMDSLMPVDRSVWDPSNKWQVIRSSAEENRQSPSPPELETSSNLEQTSKEEEPVTLESEDQKMAEAQGQTQAPPATQTQAEAATVQYEGGLPPAEVLQQLAEGKTVKAEAIQQVLQTLAKAQLSHVAEKAALQSQIDSHNALTKEQLETTIKQVLASQQNLQKLTAPEGEAEPAADAMADAEAPAGGMDASEVYKNFVGSDLTPDQMRAANRMLEVTCHNDVQAARTIEFQKQEIIRLRKLVGKNQSDADAAMTQVNGMLHNAMGGADGTMTATETGSLANSAARGFGASSSDDGADCADGTAPPRPNKRAKPEPAGGSAFSLPASTAYNNIFE